jgi:hypothetical protein
MQEREPRIACPEGAPHNGCLAELSGWLDEIPQRAGLVPSSLLKIVIIEQSDNLRLAVHRTTFRELFRLFRLDDYLLYLIIRNVDGFYDPNPSQSSQEEISSYFLHVRASYMLLWSFSRQESNTKAILLSRLPLIDPFVEELQVNQNLACHPLTLLLVCSGHLLQKIDQDVNDELRTIANVEQVTGFHREHEEHDDHGRYPRNTDLGTLSACMSDTSVKLVQYTKDLSLVRTVTALLKNRPQPGEDTSDHPPALKAEGRDIAEASRLLYTSSEMTINFVDYLLKRAEIQHTVVSRPCQSVSSRIANSLTS